MAVHAVVEISVPVSSPKSSTTGLKPKSLYNKKPSWWFRDFSSPGPEWCGLIIPSRGGRNYYEVGGLVPEKPPQRPVLMCSHWRAARRLLRARKGGGADVIKKNTNLKFWKKIGLRGLLLSYRMPDRIVGYGTINFAIICVGPIVKSSGVGNTVSSPM